MSRLSLSPSDKQARDWFVSTTESLGCKTTVDAMGNIFAIRPGRDMRVAPVYAGSHLDTQPTGGRYDGILGVCAGIEMLRVLQDQDIETQGPVGVVNWTNEEGARFPISMVASGVWSEGIGLRRAHALKEVAPTEHGGSPRTMKEELENIGYLGSVDCSHRAMPMAAHFELHIEQGPHLVNSGEKVGILEGVQAYKWFTVTVEGRDAHTGTTAFEHRADALHATAKFIAGLRKKAKEAGCLASVGIIEAKPGSVNTVPGLVKFSLDIRAKEDRALEDFVRQTKAVLGMVVGHEKCTRQWSLDFESPATVFHKDCIGCVEEAAKAVTQGQGEKVLVRKMISGAGHDSVFASKQCPTSMIFIPCRDGVSHHPAEYSTPEDCAKGASVLTGAVVRYDRMRKLPSS